MRMTILLLFLVGCSKSSDSGTPPRPDISEMSVQDALYTKYQKLQLVCGSEMTAPGQPATTRGPYPVWDILKHYAPEKTFLFRESVGDLKFSFEAHGKLGLVRAVDYSVGTKAVHAVDVARFSGAPTEQTLSAAGQVTVARDNQPFTLTDSLPVTLVQSVSGGYSVRLTCALESRVKPGFEADVSAP